MRRLSATQVAAVTAATVTVWGLAADKLKIPVLAMVPIIQDAHAALTELEEIVVTSTSVRYNVNLERFFANGAHQTVGRQDIRSGGSGQTLSTQSKQAQECALMYSKGELGPNSGPNPAYTVEMNTTDWGWGTNNPNLPSPVPTTTNVSPGPDYFPINAQTITTSSTHKTIVYEKRVNAHAIAAGLTFKQKMIETLVHEYYHQWFPNDADALAADAGADALARYNADGQNQSKCQNQPG